MRTYLFAAAFAASVLFAACGGTNSGPVTPPATSGSPGAVALASPVAGSPFLHVIVVIQENRTFDNLFASSALPGNPDTACSAATSPAGAPPGYGPYPDLDGAAMGLGAADSFTSPLTGSTTCLAAIPFEAPYDPDHTNAALYAEAMTADGGGFLLNGVENTLEPSATPAPGIGMLTFGAVPAPENLLYHILAYYNALADNMFSSRLAPTFPGHQFLIAGQSGGSNDPILPNATAPPNGDAWDADNPVNWGCDATAGSTVSVFTNAAQDVSSPANASTNPFPCFNYTTIGDLMDKKGVSWKYYTGVLGNTIEAAFNGYDAIEHIRQGADWNNNISTPETNIISDIQNCKLPNVAYVTPPGLSSDHAGSLSSSGPGWVGSIYLAVAESQATCGYWTNTAIVVTWDDSGGWYDHVKPPVVNGVQWGFRVPLIFASAYSPKSSTPGLPYTSHRQRDFGSILAFIEKNWNLGNLGGEDAQAAGDALSDMYKYPQTPATPIPATKIRALISAAKFNLTAASKDRTPPDNE